MLRAGRGNHAILVPALILAAVSASILANGPHPYYRQAKADINMAIMARDADKVKNLIAGGADVNKCEDEGAKMAPLHFAVGMGAENIAALLIEKGARLDVRDAKGNTPLHYTVMGGNMAESGMVKFLIDRGAQASLANKEGNSVLHLAVGYTDDSILELMIRKGGGINQKNSEGRTPLHMAVYNESVDAVKVLLKNNADTTVKDNRGYTPMDLITRRDTKYGTRNREAGEYDRRLEALKNAFAQPGAGRAGK